MWDEMQVEKRLHVLPGLPGDLRVAAVGVARALESDVLAGEIGHVECVRCSRVQLPGNRLAARGALARLRDAGIRPRFIVLLAEEQEQGRRDVVVEVHMWS